MNKGLAYAALLAILAAGSARAADLPSAKAPPPVAPPPPSWSGYYVGVNLGGTWLSGNGDTVYLPYADPRYALLATAPGGGGASNFFLLPGGGSTPNGNQGGFIGGGQIGYNYQLGPSFLVGVETDFQGASVSVDGRQNFAGFYPSPFTPAGGFLAPLVGSSGGNLGLSWLGTVRGRLGYIVAPTLLVYGTAGFAYGDVSSFNSSSTRTGWTAGGGAEWLVFPDRNWTARIEYLYASLAADGGTGGSGWSGNYSRNVGVNVVRVGLNYRFDPFSGLSPIRKP
ncbi:MAG TPA: outer membrane beta-barrel protein [Methylocystis sp.]|nr:outer membrane beta-barrel protein [Methylocystis sp.]